MSHARIPRESVASRIPADLPEEFGFTVEQDAGVDTTESIHVKYYANADEIRISNVTLQDDVESPSDVGESVARTLFEGAFRGLVEKGIVDEKHYDLTKVLVSRTVTSWGSAVSSAPVTEVVNTYDFLARRTLNGIPFVNQGILIAIHRSGRVARVRVGGAHPIAIQPSDVNPTGGGLVHAQSESPFTTGSTLNEVPAGSGFIFSSAVDATRYKGRFQEEYPRGMADKSGVMYMLPMSSRPRDSAGVVEPLFVFSYSSRFGEDASRRQYVGYSLRDPSAPPIDLSEKPEPDAKGDARE